jgi:DNA mismatch repair protein MutL
MPPRTGGIGPAAREALPTLKRALADKDATVRPGSSWQAAPGTELLENSIDAGATRIDVEVGSGGIDLIRVVDDGCGIESDDLRHREGRAHHAA